MNKAKWIWYKSDFEIYHNMMLHNRRVDMGVEYPTKWHLDRPPVLHHINTINDYSAYLIISV